MKPITRILALLSAAVSVPAVAGQALPPGIWTNTEDVYFAQEEGRPVPAPIAIQTVADGHWRPIDAFGTPVGEWSASPLPGLAPREGGGWQVNGSELRRAARYTCWVSTRKFAGKPDGNADWTFASGLETFDQGGRVNVPGHGEAPDVQIHLRNVTWAAGSRNKPSLVLYIHRDDPRRAESYSWSSPDAALIGINLRWVQASCSRVDG